MPGILSAPGVLRRGGGQAAAHHRAAVLLDEIDAVGGDREPRLIVARHELLLAEVPERELQVLAGLARELRQLERRERGIPWLGAPPRVENLEQGRPDLLLDLEIVVALDAGGELP